MSKSKSPYKQTIILNVNRKSFPKPEILPKDEFASELIREIYKNNLLIEYNVFCLSDYIKRLEEKVIELGGTVSAASIVGGFSTK